MIARQWFEPGGGVDGDGRAPIVLLHEGLGSISAWGRFPQLLADRCARRVLAYDRPGYGRSRPEPGPWPADFLQRGATELAGVLAEEAIDRPLLVGHSDGASIALLYPCHGVPAGGPPPVGVVSISAHVFVEPINVEVIGAMRADYPGTLGPALARHHRDADAVFDAWSEVWVSDRFSTFEVDADLAAVTCPTLALQGAVDKYGTDEQLHRVAAAVGGPVRSTLIDGADHWPHKEATDEVLALIGTFSDPLP